MKVSRPKLLALLGLLAAPILVIVVMWRYNAWIDSSRAEELEVRSRHCIGIHGEYDKHREKASDYIREEWQKCRDVYAQLGLSLKPKRQYAKKAQKSKAPEESEIDERSEEIQRSPKNPTTPTQTQDPLQVLLPFLLQLLKPE